MSEESNPHAQNDHEYRFLTILEKKRWATEQHLDRLSLRIYGKKEMTLLQTVHISFGMIKQQKAKELGLHLSNHEYSNMNIAYINDICLPNYCAKQNIHIY